MKLPDKQLLDLLDRKFTKFLEGMEDLLSSPENHIDFWEEHGARLWCNANNINMDKDVYCPWERNPMNPEYQEKQRKIWLALEEGRYET